MPVRDKLGAVAILAAIALAAPIEAQAGALSVSPTTIDLPASGGAAVLYVANRGTQPTTVQVESFDWTQTDGTDRLDASQALQISPPFAQLAPGQRQIIRLLVRPGGGSQAERAFRLVVSELPNPASPVNLRMRVLLQFSVPVFAGPAHAISPQLVWDARVAAGSLLLTARNDGNTRAKLTSLRLVTAKGRKRNVAPGSIVYVLSGASRQWAITASDISAGDRLRIEGLDEHGATASTFIIAHR